MCFNCPVFNECKQYRRKTGSEFGIWAGELFSPAKGNA